MYGYRGNNSVRNFILAFLAGWLFGQFFTVNFRDQSIRPNQAIQRTRG